MNDPKNTSDENDEPIQIDSVARDTVEQFDGYKEYQREMRGDSLNFGDY